MFRCLFCYKIFPLLHSNFRICWTLRAKKTNWMHLDITAFQNFIFSSSCHMLVGISPESIATDIEKYSFVWTVLEATLDTFHEGLTSSGLLILLRFASKNPNWGVEVAHLYNTARTFSSPSRCFHLSTNLDRDFFRYRLSCDAATVSPTGDKRLT